MRARILEQVESASFEVLPGLQQRSEPIGICETETLSAALSLEDAVNTLETRLLELQLDPPPMGSGILRFQVPLPPGIQALHWLECQPKSSPLLPRLYFSSRQPQVENNTHTHDHELMEVIDNDTLRAIAGTGACVLFQGSKPFSLHDWHSIRRFLSEESPLIRAYGSMRFNPHTPASTEWSDFGSFYFFIPQIELCECYSCSLLSVNIAWESSVGCSLQTALEKASWALKTIYIEAKTEMPKKINKIICKEHVPDEQSWHLTFKKVLDMLDNEDNFKPMEGQQEVSHKFQVRKIVLARQTRLELDGVIEPLQLLASMQEKNPSAYQFSIELANGIAFFGNTPERLFARNGQWVASESVAGTRPRGPTTSSDYQIGLELLTSSKDNDEFAIVREGVREVLEKVCTDVTTTLHKGLVKQPRVQHLYSRMIGKLHRDSGEYELLAGLHPTPAVCGQPQESARMIISLTENFDRGMYAGPVGWFGGNSAEFAVGIRSSLIRPQQACKSASPNNGKPMNAKNNFSDAALEGTQMFLYAGVGIVKGSEVSSEWRELELKISQFEALLQPRIELREAININALWAKLIVEECIRLGVTYFCIAPGSRSSPLIEAAASNPHASCISCFDERSLAFYALGYGRGARKPAAIITSSGTAVSNLLPAVVEASQDSIPMLLLTADRPPELRGTGANQVIDQVHKEVCFQLALQQSLTEPFIASFMTSSLPPNSALFLGNSMPIRDVDMYAGPHQICSKSHVARSCECLPGIGIHVAANRGASGIDGIISTAIGFGAGTKKRLTLLIGDLSFIYDTNGLILMKTRINHLPLTIIVVNNNGGGIFSMLPLSKTMEAAAFTSLVSTRHDINLANICHGHGVNHMLVQTKEEFSAAIQSIQASQSNWVLEVTTNIKDNSEFHRKLQMSTIQALDRTTNILKKFSTIESSQWTVSDVKYYHFRLPLYSCTSAVSNELQKKETSRDGLLLQIVLSNGYSGFGEIAPLEGLHHESLLDAEQQLRFIGQKLNGVSLNWTLSLLDGSFTTWIQEHLQVKANTLFPSVRCGLEMAVLGALSACTKDSLLYLLSGMPSPQTCDGNHSKEAEYTDTPKVHVCGLVDSQGSPEDVARIASELVRQGFTTLKLKVGRRTSPLEDAAVVVAVRNSVGKRIQLRVDANQRWSLLKALEFSDAVQNCHLQYIEEPVQKIADIEKFCKNSNLPVALDESIDTCSSDCQEMLQALACHGVVAVVIKPGRVGGFERAYSLARVGQNHGLIVVISAAFESTYSLAAYAQFAVFVRKMHEEAMTSSSCSNCKTRDINKLPAIAHGLGTYMWLKEDIITNKLPFAVKGNDGMEVQLPKLFQQQVPLRSEVVGPPRSMSNAIEHAVTILVEEKLIEFHIWETQNTPEGNNKLTLVFLHGFLGTGKEWLPIMNSLSTLYHCISLDLPGHGQSKVTGDISKGINGSANLCKWSMEFLSEAISKLLDKLGKKNVILIGYSMGARLAMYMALRKSQQVSGAVIVSGSPGLKDSHIRATRAAEDDGLAEYLRKYDLKNFVNSWYKKHMWKSLREHPAFKNIREDRIQHSDSEGLADCLSALSIGRQPSLWEALPQAEVPMLVVVGSRDEKFVDIAHEIQGVLTKENEHMKDESSIEILKVEDCGHAVHLEHPLSLIKALHMFVLRVTSSFRYKEL